MATIEFSPRMGLGAGARRDGKNGDWTPEIATIDMAAGIKVCTNDTDMSTCDFALRAGTGGGPYQWGVRFYIEAAYAPIQQLELLLHAGGMGGPRSRKNSGSTINQYVGGGLNLRASSPTENGQFFFIGPRGGVPNIEGWESSTKDFVLALVGGFGF